LDFHWHWIFLSRLVSLGVAVLDAVDFSINILQHLLAISDLLLSNSFNLITERTVFELKALNEGVLSPVGEVLVVVAFEFREVVLEVAGIVVVAEDVADGLEEVGLLSFSEEFLTEEGVVVIDALEDLFAGEVLVIRGEEAAPSVVEEFFVGHLSEGVGGGEDNVVLIPGDLPVVGNALLEADLTEGGVGGDAHGTGDGADLLAGEEGELLVVFHEFVSLADEGGVAALVVLEEHLFPAGVVLLGDINVHFEHPLPVDTVGLDELVAVEILLFVVGLLLFGGLGNGGHHVVVGAHPGDEPGGAVATEGSKGKGEAVASAPRVDLEAVEVGELLAGDFSLEVLVDPHVALIEVALPEVGLVDFALVLDVFGTVVPLAVLHLLDGGEVGRKGGEELGGTRDDVLDVGHQNRHAARGHFVCC